ncbi:serine hydrolase [Bacillus sp. CECT 9360]|uniref:serine hydrolase n=1 Tax=Bacillus sp. CECT 9360 TaxID=2845821 RepID=UPI001E5F2B07|nr:serine hydrolase [Bacillus sp. CECT 9360]CAH0345770.1 hypothetical protein BCI9360_02068 [Bacillus sp. CECT 9360]
MEWIALEESIMHLKNHANGRIGVHIEIDGKVIESGSQETFQSASLIKIPILIEAFRQNEEKHIYLNQPVTIPMTERVKGSGVIYALTDKVFMTIGDIITLMIIVSDNTATNLLINFLGQDEINRCIKELGLDKTVLNRRMMDFEAINQGKDNLTSATDMLVCLKAIKEETFLSTKSNEQILSIMRKQQMTDKLQALMDPEKVSVANKTGSLPGIVHDCAIITYGEKTAYVAVLTSVSSEEEGRQVIAKIGKLVYEYLVQ